MTTAEPVVVTAYFYPSEGQRGAVLEALGRAIPQVHQEPGCNLYCIQEAPDGSIVMIEHWDSVELLNTHGEGAPVAELNWELDGKLSQPVAVTRLKPIHMGEPSKGALMG